ncbi:unnamed protein product [Effrenium voratum]|uniref:G domain-containing protein n=1 Tax=Effrenium voratum TaxID=2562239 RepID=A0AA36IHC3_9DINO|nr:unnamed protein product [Effrenium voratum]
MANRQHLLTIMRKSVASHCSGALLLSTICFTVVALTASASFILTDYLRRVAIDEAVTQGVGLRLNAQPLHKTRLGGLTLLLAGVNQILLFADLFVADWNPVVGNLKDALEVGQHEVMMCLLPLVWYFLSLSSICECPLLPWSAVQSAFQEQIPLCNFLTRQGDRPQQSQSGQSRTSFGSRSQRRPDNCNEQSMVEMVHMSQPPNPSRTSFSQETVQASQLAKEDDKESGDLGYLLAGFPKLMAARPYSTCTHLLLVLASVATLSVASGVLLKQYRFSFEPRLLTCESIGGRLIKVDRLLANTLPVNYYILPEDKTVPVTLFLQPDPTLATRLAWHPPGGANERWQIQRARFKAPAVHNFTLLPEQFGLPASIRMTGIIDKTITFLVLGVSQVRAWLRDDLLGDWKHQPWQSWHVNRARLTQQTSGPQAVSFTVQADWALLDLQYEMTLKPFEGGGAMVTPSCSSRLQQATAKEIRCFWQENGQFFPECPGSCDVNMTLKVAPRDAGQQTVFRFQLSQTYQLSMQVEQNQGFVLNQLRRIQRDFDWAADLKDSHTMKVLRERRGKLLEEEYAKEIKTRCPSTPAECDSSASRIILVGLTGAGKSSVCRYITNSAQCEPSNSLKSHTSKVTEVVQRAFGDCSKTCVHVFDIPGYRDTRGEAFDQEQWSRTMHELNRRNRGRPVKQIVWVVNGASKRYQQMHRDMLLAYRRYFGTAFYRHLTLLVNFVRTAQYGPSLAHAQEWTDAFSAEVLEGERQILGGNSGQWNAVRGATSRAVADNLKVIVADADPDRLEEAELSVPLSAPFVHQLKEFQEANLAGLIRMMDGFAEDTQDGLWLNATCAQMGWGTLSAQETTAEIDVIRSQTRVSVLVKGSYLGLQDQLSVQPLSSKCTAQPPDGIVLKPDAGSDVPDSLTFTFFAGVLDNATLTDVEAVRLCFAEAAPFPAFCQDGGLFPIRSRFTRALSMSVPNLQKIKCKPCRLGGKTEALRRHPCKYTCVPGSRPVGFENLSCSSLAVVRHPEDNTMMFVPRLPVLPECKPVPCPLGSWGSDVVTGCGCGPFHRGDVAATITAPYYRFSCVRWLRNGRVRITKARGQDLGRYLSSRRDGFWITNGERDALSTWVVVHAAPVEWEIEYKAIKPGEEFDVPVFRLRKASGSDVGCYLATAGPDPDRWKHSPTTSYAFVSCATRERHNTWWSFFIADWHYEKDKALRVIPSRKFVTQIFKSRPPGTAGPEPHLILDLGRALVTRNSLRNEASSWVFAETETAYTPNWEVEYV